MGSFRGRWEPQFFPVLGDGTPGNFHTCRIEGIRKLLVTQGPFMVFFFNE